MKCEVLAKEYTKKWSSRKWIHFERTYSNSLWHIDYKKLDDGR